MPDSPMGPAVVINIQYGGSDNAARFDALEALMATANEQLVELKAQVADVAADVLAKLEQLEQQAGNLTPEAQATLDEIKGAVTALDEAVGDADGSDTPVPPVDPTPAEPTA